ncbi:MAG: zinc-ribbon domain containing protein [Candidatus Kerfeldbacteria bacterium]|nr:zinc-ribbon domain containing protein [Candidatus Kerfeldbacteria bacterium]
MTKQCKQCSKTFQISSDDQTFYQKISVPEPTLCPDCRSQRRLVWRNERSLYSRQCDLCHKPIISLYRANSPYTVYCYACWYSDQWNGSDYAREIDWQRSFFDQFKELQLRVPRLSAFMVNNENCEYTNGTLGCKDCYMIFASDHNENCMYSYGIFSSVTTLDVLSGKNCELCYDCIGCTNCFNVRYSEDASNCNTAYFLLDCKGCGDCFMSYGLHNRNYVWKNEQLTEAEYKERLAKTQLGSTQTIKRLKADFKELKKKHTFKYYHGQNNDNFSGDYLERCHNTWQSFECYEIDNCKFITHGNQIKDCYDGYMNVDQCELGYELVGSVGAYNTKFAAACYTGSYSYYIDSCKQVKNVFGCIGLQNQQYCILNKQYSEQEYCITRDKLIKQMSAIGEYGEFFPVSCSPFTYNETAAMDSFPLSQTDVVNRGWNWHTPPDKQQRFSSYRLPDTIDKVEDDVLENFLTCEQCQTFYKIIPAELRLYREHIIPVPRQCFNCRHAGRLQQHTQRSLWQRQCMCTRPPGQAAGVAGAAQPEHGHGGLCQNNFETAYSTDSITIVYCEDCYNKTIV